MGTGYFPGIKSGRGVLLTTHPLLVPRSWKSRAIPLPTLWATPDFTFCRSQWPRRLRRRSTAARLLRSWVRIPPGAWIFICCECCQVEVSVTRWSLVQRNPTECGVLLCVILKPRDWGGPAPLGAVAPERKEFRNNDIYRIFITCLTMSVLFPTQCVLFHRVIFSCPIIFTLYLKQALKFKYSQPRAKGEVLLIIFRVDWNYNCHNYIRNTALHKLRTVRRTPYLLRLLKNCL